MYYRLNIVFLSACLFLALLWGGTGGAFAQGSAGVDVVVLDPGHGGRDPGTVYGTTYEKDINLGVALALGRMIRENFPGVKVIYTRERDEAVALQRRGEIANRAGADLFISIHVNATDRNVAAPSGALTLVMGLDEADTNLDRAMKENDVIMYEEDYTATYKEYLSGSSEMFITYALTQFVNIDQSIVFADILQRHYKTGTPMPDKGVRQQKLLVLYYTTMPAVLTELGFLNNEHDRRALTGERGQRSMAMALFNAFSEYKARTEGHDNPLRLELADGNAPAAEPAASGVVYRVQIMSASRRVAPGSRELGQWGDGVVEERDGSRWRYYVGGCATYADATELQARVRRSFADAFVVAFDRAGRRITVPEARRLE